MCRSDWHAWSGHDDSVSLPHIPGHEFAGVIEDIDPAVPGFKKGDRVTAPFIFACGD
ncbi:alcohol dehydrogenase catalytic domain-containing protein [Corynebacterium phoceense]|uniref:alcohol dehydrogenase catalytic domain-containing protein n=1 Tax=Corynebacterium phoceense TaxID=1686286 RepID=UPI00215C7146|nr:alcohol dehydrogenase catalytic domain-containing protein [Corynebacterium phoceense]